MNEFDYLRHLRAVTENRGDSTGLVLGIGDDAAAFKSSPGIDTVVSTDLLIEGIDFRRDTTFPGLLGHKTLSVSLSDIAAMGARPRWALLSIGMPRNVWESVFLDQFNEGALELAERFGVKLIGGDLSRTMTKIVLNSVLIGECSSRKEVLRSGARPGDQIFVTGQLGDAAAGLRLLEHGARLRSEKLIDADVHSVDPLLLSQLRPEPRVGWGILLGDNRLATSMIDISDGLSSDLHHLCRESGVGAVIDASLLPINRLVVEICGRRALDPLMLALHGGEDFELLFTVSPENVSKLPRRVDGVQVNRIGEITDAGDGVRVAEGKRVWNLEPHGWQHFGKDS